MAEKEQPVGRAPATANGHVRSDEEAAQSRELRHQKRRKCLIYIAAFVVFQTAVIVIFSLTVMKIRNPKYKIRSATFGNVDTPSNGGFNISMNARLGVKNMNFGTYKFDATTITFYYENTIVGSAEVPKSKAGWLTHKKFTVTAQLSSPSAQISSDLIPITARSNLTGKVTLTFIFKKKKNTQMNCNFEINRATNQLQNIKC